MLGESTDNPSSKIFKKKIHTESLSYKNTNKKNQFAKIRKLIHGN